MTIKHDLIPEPSIYPRFAPVKARGEYRLHPKLYPHQRVISFPLLTIVFTLIVKQLFAQDLTTDGGRLPVNPTIPFTVEDISDAEAQTQAEVAAARLAEKQEKLAQRALILSEEHIKWQERWKEMENRLEDVIQRNIGDAQLIHLAEAFSLAATYMTEIRSVIAEFDVHLSDEQVSTQKADFPLLREVTTRTIESCATAKGPCVTLRMETLIRSISKAHNLPDEFLRTLLSNSTDLTNDSMDNFLCIDTEKMCVETPTPSVGNRNLWAEQEGAVYVTPKLLDGLAAQGTKAIAGAVACARFGGLWSGTTCAVATSFIPDKSFEILVDITNSPIPYAQEAYRGLSNWIRSYREDDDDVFESFEQMAPTCDDVDLRSDGRFAATSPVFCR